VYCRLLGYTRMELLGRRIHDIEGNETQEQVKHHLQRSGARAAAASRPGIAPRTAG